LESRLKEANEKVQECDRLHAIPQVQIKLLEQRLSHLMDVAGKMAGALQPFHDFIETREHIAKQSNEVRSGIYKMGITEKDILEAKLALASWLELEKK
jgi:hypothetical protein